MSSSLTYWRQFLQTTKYDIFETIVSAIHLAATDYPAQFEDKQEYLQQTISTALSSNLLQCIPSEDKYNTKLKKKNRRKEKVIDQIFNKAKMNFVENWSSDDDDDNACISDWMKKKSEIKQRKRKGKRVANDIKVAKRTSWRARDAHTETGSSSMWHMSNAIGIVNDGSATNLVAKEVVEVEVEVGVAVEVERDTLTKKSDLLEDVSKIRDALMKLKGQPVIAYDLLMRLEKMDISAHVLKVTEIAVIVSSFAKDDYCSDSLQTRLLASSLLESWRIILDKWLDNSNSVRDTEKVTVATEIVEPKSTVIEATKRTGSIQFHEGPSKPQSSRPIFDIGSSSSGNARCIGAGQPTGRYKNRQLTSSSQVQIRSSSRANNNTSLKSQPRYGLHQGPNLTIRQIPNAKNKMEVPAPAKKIEEVDRVRESLEIARRKVQERFQKSEPDARCMGACQPAERHHLKNRQLTGGSQIQIGGSSRAYGSTSFKSQPRYGLQGPKLTVKESLDDAKNKMKVPAPAEKTEEDPVRESLELAKRKLQERLHKSEQAKRHNTGLQNADKDTPIGELLSRYRRGPC